MAVRSLGYIGIGVSDVSAWRNYAGQVLGLHVDDALDGGLRLRVDSRAWRIAIEPGGPDDILYAGYEVDGSAALAELTTRLTAAGVTVTFDPARAERRGVVELAHCVDPAGVPCELFWGATERFETPLVSPTGVQGFVTGEQGLGHIVLVSMEPARMREFYGLLGFTLSDLIYDPRRGPDKIVEVQFMHCNGRHHSLATATAPAPVKLLHFMLQARELDDVGFALDRVEAAGVKLSLSLGRHVNDHMVSFYAFTPSGFEVEYGWGARTLDATWAPVRHERISSWGHKTINFPGTGWKY